MASRSRSHWSRMVSSSSRAASDAAGRKGRHYHGPAPMHRVFSAGERGAARVAPHVAAREVARYAHRPRECLREHQVRGVLSAPRGRYTRRRLRMETARARWQRTRTLHRRNARERSPTTHRGERGGSECGAFGALPASERWSDGASSEPTHAHQADDAWTYGARPAPLMDARHPNERGADRAEQSGITTFADEPLLSRCR